MKQIRIGVILSYLILIANTITGIIMTPFLLKHLGEAEYAIYQLIVAVSGYFTILNLGTGSAMTRFVSMYKAKNDKIGEQKYITLNLLTTSFLVLIIIIIGILLSNKLSFIFPNILRTTESIQLAGILCKLTTINIGISFYNSTLDGLIRAYGKIGTTQIFTLFRLIIRMAGILLLVYLGFHSTSITFIDIILSLSYFSYLLFYCVKKLKIKLYFSRLDKAILYQTILFSGAALLSSLSGQLNNNIDKILLGIFTTDADINIYSIATTFYIMFASASSCLNGVFLNEVTILIYSGISKGELTDYNAKIGRFQNCILGYLFGGFIIAGKDFFILWLGGYEEAYIFSLILMGATYLAGIGGIGETILDAVNKKLFKSVTVVIIGIINVIVTIYLIKRIGSIGAPIATAIATIVGYVIILNIYYHRRIGLEIIRMYKQILKGILPCQILSIFLIWIINTFLLNQIQAVLLRFVTKGCVYTLIYGIGLWIIALNHEEKEKIKGVIYKRKLQNKR